MKEIIILSKTGKMLCLANLKNNIRIMFIVMGIFTGSAITDAIMANWSGLINNTLFALWAFVVTRWMNHLQKAYEFFDEAREEVEVHRSKTDKK